MLLEKMKTHPNFKAQDGSYKLHVVVPIEECLDEVFRVSLMFQLEKDDWFGRYYFHLPSAIPSEDVAKPTEAEIYAFKTELALGMDILLDIIDRELSDGLPQQGDPVTVGSLYIVGSDVGWLVDPSIMKFRNSELLEEKDTSILVRIPGDPDSDAASGAMSYGIHYFTKDQVHTFEKN